MNHSDKNDEKKKPSPIEPSSKQNDDNDKSDHNENSIESANSTKPGAVTVSKSVYASKTMQKTDVQSKYDALFYRAIALPGHYPINEEPGSNFMNELGYLEKIERSISKCTVSVTSQDVVAVKDTKNSNVKGKKKLRPQLYKHMAVIESTTSKKDNENIENRVNFESKNIASNVVRENAAKSRSECLKRKLKNCNSTPFTNDASDTQQNVSKITESSSNQSHFAKEKEAHPIITTSSIEEGVNYEQDRHIANEGNDNYEMPIATTVNDGEVSLSLPHAEPNNLEDNVLVIVDAEAVVPWYKQKKVYAMVVIVVMIIVLAVMMTSNLSNTQPSNPSAPTLPSNPFPSAVPSSTPSLSTVPSLSLVPSSAPSFSPFHEALTDLYNSTSGDNWNNKRNWFSFNETWCSWHGLTCETNIDSCIANSESIIEISLPLNQLKGSIVSTISNLSSLKELSLQYNSLTGTIPTEIGLLFSLDRLELCVNAFTGAIPSEIGLLSSLKYLYFFDNSLNGTIPTEIGVVSSLDKLYFNKNSLTGSIPSEFGLLSRLEYLYLNRNSLTGTIPTEIGFLTSLKNLYLGDTLLSGLIPSEIGLLSNLEWLVLSNNNQMSGNIPMELYNSIDSGLVVDIAGANISSNC